MLHGVNHLRAASQPVNVDWAMASFVDGREQPKVDLDICHPVTMFSCSTTWQIAQDPRQDHEGDANVDNCHEARKLPVPCSCG